MTNCIYFLFNWRRRKGDLILFFTTCFDHPLSALHVPRIITDWLHWLMNTQLYEPFRNSSKAQSIWSVIPLVRWVTGQTIRQRDTIALVLLSGQSHAELMRGDDDKTTNMGGYFNDYAQITALATTLYHSPL